MEDFLPHGIGDSIRAWCREGGRFGEGELDLIFGERGGGGLS